MASKAPAPSKKVEDLKKKDAEKAKKIGPEHLKDYQDLKSLLRNSKVGDENNLYEHVVEVMNHIIIHCPEEALNKFEEISFLLKKENKNSIDMN
mmetsp:Transcript_6705/g.4838  ORF Transcript_6705/g.4838 Transcript_6705/m.4838 type:complete len:94 (-) Transcript_6705:660-941(-)